MPPPKMVSGIVWHQWSPDLFAQAKRENKFVLLDLQAVWCHWCHVMDDVTYSDPRVIALINQKYIAVKVDQDSRPDLSDRYENYGWPATVVFNGDAGEIVKRAGYIPPMPMARMLQAIIDDPSPGPSVTAAAASEAPVVAGADSALSKTERSAMLTQFNSAYDPKEGGWGTIHKFIDADAIEYEMNAARHGDAGAATRVRQTLDAGFHLIDPVWGGVYQYSTDGDWVHPHFEKIMQFQADDMRTYAAASVQFGDPRYAKAAEDIHRFLTGFLASPDGAIYTSEDADVVEGEESDKYFAMADAGRRKVGLPRIDTHVYARENGWAIASLCRLHDLLGDAAALEQAENAARWVLASRALPGGGFRHDDVDSAGPYLADTLAMGRAFLALYKSTADRQWLGRAQSAADFVATHLASRDGGFVTSAASADPSFAPKAQVDENVAAAGFFNLLGHYTGNRADAASARLAMRYLATPRVVESRRFWVAGILLADDECSTDPLHVTVVGTKTDPSAIALYAAALRCPGTYSRVEWQDPTGPPLPNEDVDYPKLKHAAAFLCTANTCSAPITDSTKLAQRMR
jgi:uncharacterized protein YyaL (SSP411 family)